MDEHYFKSIFSSKYAATNCAYLLTAADTLNLDYFKKLTEEEFRPVLEDSKVEG